MSMNILPPTSKRVQSNTNGNVNQAVKEHTICKLNKSKRSDEDDLSNRINKVNKEWDTGRFLEANAAFYSARFWD